jgi:hypothetical protein
MGLERGGGGLVYEIVEFTNNIHNQLIDHIKKYFISNEHISP